MAAEVASPAKGGSSRVLILPLLPRLGSQIAARNWSTWLVHAGAVVHRRLRPADDLAPVVDAGGEAVVPAEGGQLAHHIVLPDEPAADEVPWFVLGRNPPSSQLQSSSSGSVSAVWEIPTTIPASFSPGHGTVLLGPPSVRRSVMTPLRQRAA